MWVQGKALWSLRQSLIRRQPTKRCRKVKKAHNSKRNNKGPELTIQEAREQILEAHHMEKGRRLLQDYDAVMDKVAEAEELRTDHRPSTLEKLAELASDTSAPKSSARSAPEL